MIYKFYLLSTLLFFNIINTAYLIIARMEILFQSMYTPFTKGDIHFATTSNKIFKKPNEYIFVIESNTSGIFKIKKDHRIEVSKYESKNINPSYYKFYRNKKDKLEIIETFFNKDSSVIMTTHTINNVTKNIEHEKMRHIQDRLSVQIDYQKKLNEGKYSQDYRIIDKGRLREYQFRHLERRKLRLFLVKQILL
ncbi:MAG: hypothetical protein Ct9H90mP18_10140 [Gammaproteobacteria bacterium]|nr:MAG: hypothetical protein Ct9H90mP18_10140 [Gammaproteobacteria bacterium]